MLELFHFVEFTTRHDKDVRDLKIAIADQNQLIRELIHAHHSFKEKVMSDLDDLQASVAALTAKADEANAKTDLLIAKQADTAASLADVSAQLAALQASDPGTVSHQQLADMKAAIDATIGKLTDEEAKEDAVLNPVAAAPAPSTPVDTGPVDTAPVDTGAPVDTAPTV